MVSRMLNEKMAGPVHASPIKKMTDIYTSLRLENSNHLCHLMVLRAIRTHISKLTAEIPPKTDLIFIGKISNFPLDLK